MVKIFQVLTFLQYFTLPNFALSDSLEGYKHLSSGRWEQVLDKLLVARVLPFASPIANICSCCFGMNDGFVFTVAPIVR